jgi:hypothetical protein
VVLPDRQLQGGEIRTANVLSGSRRADPVEGRSRSPLVWPIAVGRPVIKVQLSVALQDDEWQVPAAAVIGA